MWEFLGSETGAFMQKIVGKVLRGMCSLAVLRIAADQKTLDPEINGEMV